MKQRSNLNYVNTSKRGWGRWWIIIAAMLLSVLISSVVYAQGGYPRPIDLYINDYANILSDEDAAQIRALFANLKNETGIEATVVTVNSINDYQGGDETIESFATNLFNTWGIGDPQQNNGVLVLVAIQDRKVRIEVGSGYGDSQNENMQEVINEYILPSFRQNEYSHGLYRGSRAIVGKLTGVWPEDLSQSSTNARQGSLPLAIEWVIALGIIGGGLLFFIIFIRRFSSSGARSGSSIYDNGGTSSSSGGFGGGGSDGGGASGDW